MKNTSIYVIDKDHRIVYCNEQLQERYPDLKTGDYCYKALFGRDEMCENCILRSPDENDSLIMNRDGHWVKLSTADIEWPGHGLCKLMKSDRVGHDRFLDLAELPVYNGHFQISEDSTTVKDLYTDAVVNRLLGAVAFYSYNEESGRLEIVSCNQKYHEMVKLAFQDDVQFRADPISGVYPPDRAGIFHAAEEIRWKPGEMAEVDFRHFRENQDVRWYHLRLFYLDEREGNRFYYGTLRDITEIQYLNQDMPGGYHRCSTAPGNEFLFISDQFLKMFGYTREEILVKFDNKYQNMVHPDDRAFVAAGVEYMKRNATSASLDYRMLSKDGYIWVTDQSRYVEYDGQIIIQGMVIDMTEKKAQELEVQKLNDKLMTTLHMARLNSWDWDLVRHELTLMNVADRESMSRISPLLGQEKAVIPNYPNVLLEKNLIVPGHEDEIWEYTSWIYSCQNQEQISFVLPFRSTRRPGEEIWLQFTGVVTWGKNGTPARAMGFYVDVTDERIHSNQNAQELRIMELLRDQSLYDLTINLSKDLIVEGPSALRWAQETGCSEHSYSGGMRHIANRLTLPDYREEYLNFSDIERLTKIYSEGTHVESLDYERRWNGRRRWFRIIHHLFQRRNSDDLYLNLFILDIDAQKKRDARQNNGEVDPLTGLWTKAYAETHVPEFIRSEPDHRWALIMFDLDNFQQVNAIIGDVFCDAIISVIAKKLQSCFRAEDAVCRLGSDEFFVLCRDPEEDFDSRMSKILELMNTTIKGLERAAQVTISAGYVITEGGDVDFLEVARKAERALTQAKAWGKNAFASSQ